MARRRRLSWSCSKSMASGRRAPNSTRARCVQKAYLHGSNTGPKAVCAESEQLVSVRLTTTKDALTAVKKQLGAEVKKTQEAQLAAKMAAEKAEKAQKDFETIHRRMSMASQPPVSK